MISHENRLPADDSHEISCLICYLKPPSKLWICRLLQIIGSDLRVKAIHECSKAQIGQILHKSYAQVTHSRTGRRVSHGCTFVAIRIGP